MKKSIQLLVLLVIVLIITDRIVSFSLTHLDRQVFTGQSVGKVNHFLTLKDSVNLLVFGSSRANHHIENKILDPSSFNMGVDGTQIAYSAALVSTLKKKEQIVLVHIDHNNIYDSEYEGTDILGLINVINRNDSIKSFIYNFLPQEVYISNTFNSYVYNGKVLGILKNYIKPKYNYNLYHGYDPLNPNQEQKDIFNKNVKLERSKLTPEESISEEIEINPLIDDFIEIIKQSCQKNNSKLIFFTSPTLQKKGKVIRSKTKEYFKSKDLSYYDFSDFFKTYNSNYWKDFTHMSSKGANIFTQKLKKEIFLSTN